MKVANYDPYHEEPDKSLLSIEDWSEQWSTLPWPLIKPMNKQLLLIILTTSSPARTDSVTYRNSLNMKIIQLLPLSLRVQDAYVPKVISG